MNEHSDTPRKVIGVHTAGCAVVAHLRTGRAIRCWRSKVLWLELKIHGMHSLLRSLGWHGTLYLLPTVILPSQPLLWSTTIIESPPLLPPEILTTPTQWLQQWMQIGRQVKWLPASCRLTPCTHGVGRAGVVLEIVEICLDGDAGGSG